MNNVDIQYLNLLNDILENGTYKQTRSGGVYSVFSRQLRFNFKDGFPILTTKKVFTRGMIHELLWFLQHSYNEHGSMNIKYLIDNNVNIWTDDAYRWFKEWVQKELIDTKKPFYYYDFIKMHEDNNPIYRWSSINDLDGNNPMTLLSLTKEEFKEWCLQNKEIRIISLPQGENKTYRFGDLGPVYGKQWRAFGKKSQVDQIQRVIDLLKTNPDDRRLLVSAWNPEDMVEMALPPCHYCFQLYTRELNSFERLEWLWDNSDGDYDEWKTATHEQLDGLNVPRRELSLMWNQRSVDLFLGWPLNLSSYSLLLAMIAQCVGMACGEVICNLGDVHIYENHLDAVKEQLSNDPSKYGLPRLRLNPSIKNIDEFTIDDIKIEDYESYPTIKAPLSVG